MCSLLISKIKCFHLKKIAAKWVRWSLTEILTRNRPLLRCWREAAILGCCEEDMLMEQAMKGADEKDAWNLRSNWQFWCIWTCQMMKAVNEEKLTEAEKIRKRKRNIEVRKFKDFMKCPVKCQRMSFYGYLEMRRKFLSVQFWKSWCKYLLICIKSLYRWKRWDNWS